MIRYLIVAILWWVDTSIGAPMTNTDLSYSDLVEAAGFMSDRLLNAEDAVLNLNKRLAAAQGEMAALRGVLEYERERAREFRSRGGEWQRVAVGVVGQSG